MKGKNCILLILFVFIVGAFVSSDMGSENYAITSPMTSSGGGESESSNFVLRTVLGIVSGVMESLNFQTSLGFFYGIDTTASDVEIVYPVDGNTYYSYVGDINYTVDVGTHCWYQKNSNPISEPVLLGVNWSGVYEDSSVGSNTWTVYCNDSAGNVGSDSVSFDIDEVVPNLYFSGDTPDDNEVINNGFFTVNVTSSDSSGEHSTFVDFDDSLVGWWKLEDNYLDSSGNNNHGSCTSCPEVTGGKRGLGYEFDGVSDYIQVPYSEELMPNNQISISLWVKPYQSSITYGAILAKDSTSSYRLYRVSNGQFRWRVNANTNWYVDSNSLTNNNEWQHLVVTYDGELKLYINGVLDITGSGGGDINQLTGDIFIGSRSSSEDLFNGSIDDVMIFDRALSEGEIEALYDASSSQYGNVFDGLGNRVYGFTAYSQDLAGNVNSTSRSVEVDMAPGDVEVSVLLDKPLNSRLGSLNVSWEDTSDGEEGFSIERSVDNSSFIEIDTVSGVSGSGSIVSYIDSDLDDNKIYYYRVRSYTGGLYSGYSSIGANKTADRTGEYSPLLDLTPDSGNNKIDLEFSEGNSDLVLYMPFEEGEGTITSDWSRYNNDGEITGASWTTGKQGNGDALSFDGSSSGVLVDDFPLIFDDSVSFSAWVYYNDDTRGILFGNYDSFNEVNFEKHLDGKLRLYWNGGEVNVYSNSNAVSINEWNHIVIIRNKQENRVEFWVNGVLDKVVLGAGSDISSTSQTFRIGRDSRTGTTVTNGLIDEVRVYNRSLTQEEIINDMQGGLIRKGLYRANDSGDDFVPVGGVYDDFSDGDLSDYYQTYSTVHTGPSLTTWSVSDNTLTASNSGSKYGTLIYEYSNVSDFVVEVDMNTSATHAGIVWAVPSLTEGTRGYQWILRDYTSNNLIQKWDSSQTYLCGQSIINLPDWFNTNEWYNLKLVVEGTNVKTYINDILSLSCDHGDGSFGPGYVGLTNYDSVTNFRNFKVTPLISSDKYNDSSAVDLARPGGATSLGSSSHDLATWSDVNNLNFNWQDANDFGTSYSYYPKAYDSSGNEDNLIFQNGFEDGIDHSSGSYGDYSIVTSNECYSGEKCLSATGAFAYEIHPDSSFFEPGKTYMLCAWVKEDPSCTLCNRYLHSRWYYDSTNTISDGGDVPNDGQWHKTCILKTLPVPTSGGFTSYNWYVGYDPDANGQRYIDELEIREIDISTITSGVNGYATSLTNGASEVSEEVVDVGFGVRSKAFSGVESGQNWYFNIKSKDNAGNWAFPNQTVSHGPFWVCNDVSGIVDSDGDDSDGFIDLTDSGNTCGCSTSDVTNSRRCSTTYDGIETGVCSSVGVCSEPVINVTLIEPDHSSYVGDMARFECNVDSNSQLSNVSLFNSFGGWGVKNQTSLDGLGGVGSWVESGFSTQSNFVWNCLACDVNNYCSSAEANFTFNVDLTNPEVSFISPTPDDLSVQSEREVNINVSSSDNYDEHSTFVDFNNSLVGWWRFDNNYGDSSGNENNGSCSGSNCPNLTNGPRGLAYKFDGSSSGVLVDDFPLIFDDSVSFSAWVYYNDDTRGILFGNYDSFNEVNFEKHLDGKLRLYWNGGEVNVYSNSNAVSINEWNHIVIIRNKQENRVEFWVNGVLDKVVLGAGSDISSTSQTFRIGRDSRTGTTVTNGSIDDVMVFDRALSFEEVQSLYDAFNHQYDNNFSNLDDGVYSIQVYSQDMAGNVDVSEERSFQINNEPPEIMIYSPENITYAYGEDVWFNVSANHSEGIDSCWFNLNNSENVSLSSSDGENYSYLNDSMESGYYTSYFQCNNTIGVLSEVVNVSFTVNHLPTVELLYPIEGENITNRSPEFLWEGSDVDLDDLSYEIIIEEHKSGGGAVCSDDYNESIIDESFVPYETLKCLSDYGYYYTWKVRAHDGMNWGPYSDEEDFYVNALIVVSLPTNEIQFGSMGYLTSNNTTDDSPEPLVIKNEGNVQINISASASSMWDVIENDSEYYQVKIDNRTGFSDAFNWLSSAFDWLNMSITGQVLLIDSLNYEDDKDSAEVDIHLEVPPNEGPGIKNSTIVFEGKLAEPEAG